MIDVSAVAQARPVRAQRPSPSGPVRGRRSPAVPFSYLAGIVIIGITLVPILFIVLGGFRTNAQINQSAVGLPHPWTGINYSSILGSAAFWEYLENSVLIAVIATVLALVLGSMAAIAISRYNFRWRMAAFLLFAVGLLFPPNVASLPLYLMLKQINLLDNPLGVALPEAAFALPFTIVILVPFMRAIPGELEDAATVDGASKLMFSLRVLLPLSVPALVTVGLLAFVQSWNQYLLPLLVFTTPTKFTLPLGVATFQSEFSQNVASIYAFTTLSMIPALAFFVFAQRRIVSGVSGLSGSVKG